MPKSGREMLGWLTATKRMGSTHSGHRDLAAGRHLLLAGHVRVPVANQTVILHTVVLMANQPVRVHFAFTLATEERTEMR